MLYGKAFRSRVGTQGRLLISCLLDGLCRPPQVALWGSLSGDSRYVAQLLGLYEDGDSVYLVQQRCYGDLTSAMQVRGGRSVGGWAVGGRGVGVSWRWVGVGVHGRRR